MLILFPMRNVNDPKDVTITCCYVFVIESSVFFLYSGRPLVQIHVTGINVPLVLSGAGVLTTRTLTVLGYRVRGSGLCPFDIARNPYKSVCRLQGSLFTSNF